MSKLEERESRRRSAAVGNSWSSRPWKLAAPDAGGGQRRTGS